MIIIIIIFVIIILIMMMIINVDIISVCQMSGRSGSRTNKGTKGRVADAVDAVIVIIIITTRPRPTFSRLGIGGFWEGTVLMSKLLTLRLKGNNVNCKSESTYLVTSQSSIIIITNDIHYDYNKLSIGVRWWSEVRSKS